MTEGILPLYLLLISGFISFALGSSDFHLINILKNYTEAKSYCRETFSDLATVHNSTEMDELIALVPSSDRRAWIGLETGDEWRWHWSWPDQQLDYYNWKAAEPQINDQDTCAAMDQHGEWMESDCGTRRSFVCHGLIFVAETKSWREAQNHCRGLSSDLISIHSAEQNQAVNNVSVAQTVWIGLFKDRWRWSDGSQTSYRYWKPNQPNYRKDQDCTAAIFKDGGKWNDIRCAVNRKFVCRGARKSNPASSNQTTTETPETTPPYTSSPGTNGTTQSHTTNSTTQSNTTNGTDQSHTTNGTTQSHTTNGTDQSHTTNGTIQSHITNGTTQSHTTIGTIQSHTTNGTTQSHTTNGTIQSHITNGTTQSHTTIGTIQSHTTNGTTQSHTTNGTDQSHTTNGTIQSHITNGTTQSHTTIGTTQSHTTNGTTQSNTTNGTTQSHTTNGTTQSNTTNGTTQSHTTNGTTQSHTTNGTDQSHITNGTTQSNTTNGTIQSHITNGTTPSHTTNGTTQSNTTNGTIQSHTTNGTIQEPTTPNNTSNTERNNTTTATQPPPTTTTEGVSTVTTLMETSAHNTTLKPSEITFPTGNLILIQENLTWIEALDYCRQHHEDLVHITTEHIQETVAEMANNASSPHIWLGLRYTCKFNFWFWTKSTTGCYQNWAPGQGPEHECGVTGAMEATGGQQWVALPETEQLNFICSGCSGSE